MCVFVFVCHDSVCVCGESGDSDGGHAPVSVPPQEPQGAAHPRRGRGVFPRGSHYAHRGDGLLLTYLPWYTVVQVMLIKLFSLSVSGWDVRLPAV